LEPLEAKAFLTVDANFTQVHDSEPLTRHAPDFDRLGRRKSMGIDRIACATSLAI
jgi:hypothetical protein